MRPSATSNLVVSMPRGSAAFHKKGTPAENRNLLCQRTMCVIRERYRGRIKQVPVANPNASLSLIKQKLNGDKPWLTDDLVAALRKEDVLGAVDIGKALFEDSEKAHLISISLRSEAVVTEEDRLAAELQLSLCCSRLLVGIDNLIHHRGNTDLVDLRDNVAGIEARARMLMNPERDQS